MLSIQVRNRIVMFGNLVLLSAFLVKTKPGALALGVVVTDLHESTALILAKL